MSSSGHDCPLCGGQADLLSTTNEWRYYCRRCDVRFNSAGELLGDLRGHVEADVIATLEAFLSS